MRQDKLQLKGVQKMLLYTASIIKPAALGLGDGESELPLALELAMLVTYYYLQRNARHEQLKSIYLPLAQGSQGVEMASYLGFPWAAAGSCRSRRRCSLPAAGERGGGARSPRERERDGDLTF